MRNFLYALLLLSSSALAAGLPVQQSKILPSESKVANFDFLGVNVSQVIQLIYFETIKKPYVIEPDVLTDQRMVTFRYGTKDGDLKKFLEVFLDSLGFSVTERNGVDFIGKKKPSETAPTPDNEIFVYRPKYRDVNFLSRLLSPLFKGTFTVNRSVAAPPNAAGKRDAPEGSATAMIDQTADVLVFSGTAKEVASLAKLLPQVDGRLGEVLVKGMVYEVSASEKDGSALSLLVSVLNGKLSVSYGKQPVYDSFVRFKNNSIDAIFAALASDSRFRVVSSPTLRIRSGANGRFTVGQDVPVLGAVSYPGNGAPPVQSVDYRSSGVIFDVSPVVYDSSVDLSVNQQLSSFVATDTGVNNSPTLIKREVKTSLSLADGDVVVLGGLAEDKDSNAKAGFSFLPAFMQSRSGEKSKTEILLVLQLNKL